ncbi:hypothetical protein lerEdw1_010907 [Lerista edwardsae]|nr:hypothetical protein lerEdw1_010907 [Lerista edwardsae]
MAILRALSSAAHGDIIPDLMDLVETILPGLLSGEDTFIRLLVTIYIQHMAHEDERVRAAAIEHLCRLRSKLPSPLLMGDALSEFVHILLHVDEEEVVATAAKAALTQLFPEVPWKVDPEDYTLHQSSRPGRQTLGSTHLHASAVRHAASGLQGGSTFCGPTDLRQPAQQWRRRKVPALCAPVAESPKAYHFTVTVLDSEEDQLSSVKVERPHSPRGQKVAETVTERGESSSQLASTSFPEVYQILDFVDRGEIAEDISSVVERPLSPRAQQTADMVIECEESSDQLPSEKTEHPHSPKLQQVAVKTVSRVHPLVGTLLITALYFGEVASACLVTLMYNNSKDHFWMALTIIFLLVPAIMDQFTLIFAHQDLTSDKPLVMFMHLILMGPLIRCMEAVGLYWTSGKKEEPYVTITRKKVLRKGSEVELEQEVGHSVRRLVTHRNAFKRMAVIQAFLGSTPQLTLQLYVTVMEQNIPTNRAILMGMCLASITHGALLCNVLAIQIRYDDYKVSLRPLAFVCISLWRSLEIGVRIFLLVLLGSVFKDYVIAVGGLNFLVFFFFLPWVEFWRSGAKLSDIAERHVSQLGTAFVLLSITLLYAGINVFCWSAMRLGLGERDLIDKAEGWRSTSLCAGWRTSRWSSSGISTIRSSLRRSAPPFWSRS